MGSGKKVHSVLWEVNRKEKCHAGRVESEMLGKGKSNKKSFRNGLGKFLLLLLCCLSTAAFQGPVTYFANF